IISSLTRFVISEISIFFTSTDATIIGSISGFSLIIMGVPILSSQLGLIKSMLLFISIMAESIFTLLLNSSITVDIFSLDMELIFSILLVVANTCSMGLVTIIST